MICTLVVRVVGVILRAHMPFQISRLPERSWAALALVVPALLVHRAHMPPQVARRLIRSRAADARVRPGEGRGVLLLVLLVLSRHRSQKSF